jgi:hypothetical protein
LQPSSSSALDVETARQIESPSPVIIWKERKSTSTSTSSSSASAAAAVATNTLTIEDVTIQLFAENESEFYLGSKNPRNPCGPCPWSVEQFVSIALQSLKSQKNRNFNSERIVSLCTVNDNSKINVHSSFYSDGRYKFIFTYVRDNNELGSLGVESSVGEPKFWVLTSGMIKGASCWPPYGKCTFLLLIALKRLLRIFDWVNRSITQPRDLKDSTLMQKIALRFDAEGQTEKDFLSSLVHGDPGWKYKGTSKKVIIYGTRINK